MTVTLTKVIDPAQGADQYTTPNNGFRFVGAVFTLSGVSGTFSDDANTDATLVGSNGQSYTADFKVDRRGHQLQQDASTTSPPACTQWARSTFQVPTGVAGVGNPVVGQRRLRRCACYVEIPVEH